MAYTSSEAPRPRWAWLPIAAAPLIWTAHFLAGYLLTELACNTGLFNFFVLGMNGLALVLLVLTLAALAAMAFAVWKAGQYGRMVREDPDTHRNGLGGFFAAAGVGLNLIFMLVVLLTGIPALFIRPCW